MSEYECTECSFGEDNPDTVAGHMLSVHGISVFDDYSRIKKETNEQDGGTSKSGIIQKLKSLV
jgi:hypothetical protein